MRSLKALFRIVFQWKTTSAAIFCKLYNNAKKMVKSLSRYNNEFFVDVYKFLTKSEIFIRFQIPKQDIIMYKNTRSFEILSHYKSNYFPII